MHKPNKPFIALTMGDPAGIGPEIIAKALVNHELYNYCRPIVIGDSAVMRQALVFCNIAVNICSIDDPSQGEYTPKTINVIDLNNVDCAKLQLGAIQAMAGKAAYEYIKKSTAMVLNKQVTAVVTAPINKESLRAANIDYIGHTEIFADLASSPNLLTLFETKGVRAFFLSRHVSLRKACDLITKEGVLKCIIDCIQALQKIGIKSGDFAVAALNPHCGEHGLFGDEELTAIIPAIKEAQSLGYAVKGPISADAIFHLAQQNQYAGILTLYHDQGHIGMKTLDFERTVSITCGLPFIRTSVDHGTAFDKAGKGIASEVSMLEAILAAVCYSNQS